MSFHLSRMLNPHHEIVWSIGEFARNVITLADAIERRSDKASCSRNTRNYVARIAPILADFSSSHTGIAAAG
jgi:hypothetical protein